MNWDISQSPGVLHGRDIVARFEELELFILECDEAAAEEYRQISAIAQKVGLNTLRKTTLVRDEYFDDYSRLVAGERFGKVLFNIWPFAHIDWKTAAGYLQSICKAVDINGIAYFYLAE